MPTGPRNINVDAFFIDEWAPVSLAPNPRGVQWNRFTNVVPNLFGGEPTVSMMTAQLRLQNPLNPLITPGLPLPEIIPPAAQFEEERYAIFIPPFLAARMATGGKAKVTLLFCVWSEINRHGLRSFFIANDDRALITISGEEGGSKDWGVGISDQIIRHLFSSSNFPFAEFEVDIAAGYSTGHRGVNGTINNGLIDISHLKRLVFLDALYRGDDPGPGPNTTKMLAKVRAVNPNVDLVVYEVTQGGTPRDASGRTAIALPPTARFIDLKREGRALQALIMARVSDAGVADGYLSPLQVPAPVQALSNTLPQRGTMASSPLTAAGASGGAFTDWASANRPTIEAAVNQSGPLVALIKQLTLTGYQFPSVGDMLHDGFIPEFGWEFLAQ